MKVRQTSHGKPAPNAAKKGLPNTLEKYLRNGASEGERNDSLFAAATQCRDIDMPVAEAIDLLLPTATGGGLSESEARTTINSAYKGPKREAPRSKGASAGGRGCQKLGGYAEHPRNDSGTVYRFATEPKAVRSANPLERARPVPVPEPFAEGFEALLMSAFEEGEGVCIGGTFENRDGEHKPDGGVTLTREQWIEAVRQRGGQFSKLCTSRNGHFIRVNPMRVDEKSRNLNTDVTSFRHTLVEFDTDSEGNTIPKDVQLGAFLASGLPITCVIDSGNKSLHAWVRLDAENAEEYKERAAKVYELFAGHDIDKQNHNPNRYSRCPDGKRTLADGEVVLQRLVKVNLGADSWDDWEMEMKEFELPEILRDKSVVTASELLSSFPAPPAPVIEGIIGVGEKLILGGSSKAGKTFCLLNLASAISTGNTWLGHECRKGEVLFINFEVSEPRMAERIRHLEKAGVGMAGVQFFNLRGINPDWKKLIAALEHLTLRNQYRLIILDPIYKLLGSSNENDNTEVARMLAEVERIAERTGAAIAFAHHFRKGNLSDAAAMDRMSGAGAFARDPDAIITMSDHEEPGCVSVEAIVRNFASPPRTVVQYQFPTFRDRADLDPSKIKGRKQGGNNKKGGPETVCEMLALQGGIMEKSALVNQLSQRRNATPKSAQNWINKAVKIGKVVSEDGLCMLSEHPNSSIRSEAEKTRKESP